MVSHKSVAETDLDEFIRITEKIAKQKSRRLKYAEDNLNSYLSEHSATLVAQYIKCFKYDGFGNRRLNKKAWEKHRNYYIDEILLPGNKKHFWDEEFEPLRRLIDDWIKQFEEDRKPISSGTFNPEEFEHFCANVLKKAGWKVSVTAYGGDQGVDVCARKGKTLVVLQCKLYSGAVGNKAVQEIFSGQSFYGANAAAVVTNSTFTNSARALAQQTGVLLLHVSDLAHLDSILKKSGNRA